MRERRLDPETAALRRLGLPDVLDVGQPGFPTGFKDVVLLHGKAHGPSRVVYVLVPIEGSVGAQVRRRALKKAERVFRRAGSHMGLERQSVPESLMDRQIKDLAWEFERELKTELWDD